MNQINREAIKKHLQMQADIQEILHKHLLDAFDEVLLKTEGLNVDVSVKDVLRMFETDLKARVWNLSVLLYPDKDEKPKN